jgi:hemolysin D
MDAVDREFLPAALELLETPPSPVRVAAIWLICAAFATALAWSYFGWLDIHAIAHGRIQPSGRSKIVQPLEPGKVIAIAVENGSRVSAGEVLVELDPTETGADREALARELESTRAEAARRRVAVAAAGADALKPPAVAFPDAISETIRRREESVLAADLAQLASNWASLSAQHAERTAARDRLVASIAAREELLALTRERADMRESLIEKGALSRALVIDSLQQHQTQVTTQVSERGQLAEAIVSVATLERKIEEVTSQFIADQMQKLADAEPTTATAPATPQNLVFPAIIGLSSRVINVGGKDIPLSPGMAVVVEIRTGQRRAIDYVLSPLREVVSSTAHER